MVKQIESEAGILKLFKVGDKLLLGESVGNLQVFDIKTCNITHSHWFREGGQIKDIVAISHTHYLLATS